MKHLSVLPTIAIEMNMLTTDRSLTEECQDGQEQSPKEETEKVGSEISTRS